MNNAMLKDKIEASGLKHKYIADRLGMSVEAYRRKREGKTPWTSSDIPVLCDVLKLTRIEAREIFLP